MGTRGTLDPVASRAAVDDFFSEQLTVVPILIGMLVILAVAGLVLVYVAFPHRGEDVPHVPWVGQVMRRGVEQLPTLDNQSDEQRYESSRR
jgi:hypothetical protein